ncbi:MAG: molybdate ABC transporter substrate-binding protein [Deltaproteobacteria bacterium]|nr:molybdate ABC transporter substrate-binding protein [Deltaproteobacteria bacterium]
MFAVVVVVAVAFAAAEPVQVAAASDLQAAFAEVGKAFEATTGTKVSFTFGSTGLLAKQLQEGAPFDVFAAASASFVDDVVKADACDGATKARYARGRIVVWTRKDAKIKAPAKLADVADPRFLHTAIANPEHAPYGIAAREALTAVGVWDKLGPRVVLGENVRQALQLADTGNADVAVVALSLAMGNTTGTYFVVDDKLHAPLEQALVVCTRGKQRSGGEAFARFVVSPEGQAILGRFGFAR